MLLKKGFGGGGLGGKGGKGMGGDGMGKKRLLNFNFIFQKTWVEPGHPSLNKKILPFTIFRILKGFLSLFKV